MLGRIIDDPAKPDIAPVGADGTDLIGLVIFEQQRLGISIDCDFIEVEKARVALVRLDKEGLSVVSSVDVACDMPGSARNIAGRAVAFANIDMRQRSEEHTSELQSLMRTLNAVSCW